MFPLQRHFSLGAVHSAGEKHLSADRNVVGVCVQLLTHHRASRVRRVSTFILSTSATHGVPYRFSYMLPLFPLYDDGTEPAA